MVGTLYGQLPYSLRYGNAYTKYKSLALKSRYWTPEQHRSYQEEKIKALIDHAYQNVRFYRNKYQRAGVEPADFRGLEDIKKFPCLTREEVKSNLLEMLAHNIPSTERLYTATSGSSGVPLELYLHKGISRPKERGFLHALWNDIGYSPGITVVVFRGEVINNPQTPWYYDPIDKQLIMSSYLLSEANIKAYCNQIRKHCPCVIQGYPFMVYTLVRLMQAAGEEPFPLQGIILESENVYEAHCTVIQSFFRCQICHYYGHSEKLLFGGNCTHSEQYHMHPEYGFMEVLSEDGTEVMEGEEGEIVATGFDNLVMPLIRYRTQDFAIRGRNQCACGLQFPMLRKVMGRAEEYIYLNDSSKVPFHNALAGIHSTVWGMVEKLQCIQKQPGHLDLHLIPSSTMNPEEVMKEFKHQIEQRIPKHKITMHIKIVDYIPVTKSGKTKLFVQMVETI
jgi:phenylacetate-CoA ligase